MNTAVYIRFVIVAWNVGETYPCIHGRQKIFAVRMEVSLFDHMDCGASMTDVLVKEAKWEGFDVGAKPPWWSEGILKYIFCTDVTIALPLHLSP